MFILMLAIHQNVWKLKTLIGQFYFGLPDEQIVLYLTFNATIVFTSATFDKRKAVLNTFYPREQLEFIKSLKIENIISNNDKRL